MIRDPVHGYIQVAAHERIIVDHPVTQRLRRINQTGLADLVYPEARTSRFAHSLGAMHLASRFLLASIENADAPDAKEFFAQIEKLDAFTKHGLKVADLDELLLADRQEGGGLKAAGAVFRHKTLQRDEKRNRRLLGLAEASLRLAALFHDLGHLPFSHDMEFALEEYISTTKRKGKPIPEGLRELVDGPPHEVIGHELASLIFQTQVTAPSPAIKAVFELARRILLVPGGFYDQPNPNAGAIEWLHSLVDGEVDVDRADYLLRDARALGFEFAVYDLERLICNLVLVRHDSLGMTTAIEERGFSALESFYVSRSRSNQYLPRHHKVAQVGIAFRFLAEKILNHDKCKEFLQTLNQVGKNGSHSKRDAEELLLKFAKFDDSWWFEVLRAECISNEPLFRACAELVLRRKPSLTSIWKRRGDLTPTQLSCLNSYLSEKLTDVPALREKLRTQGMLMLIHRFRPIVLRETGVDAGESLMLLKTGKNLLVPVTKHSVLVRSLIKAWKKDIHMHVFQMAPRSVTLEEAVRLILAGGG